MFNSKEIINIVEEYKEEGVNNMLVETLKKEMEKDRKEAKRLGKAEVKVEGRLEGRIIERKTVAKEMIRSKVKIENIIQWTKLSEDEIEELKKEV